MATYVNLIVSKCRPQDEDRFLKWWAEVHIPLLLKYKGLKSVTRYKLASDDMSTGQYLAIQEFYSKADMEGYNGSPEVAAVREEIKRAWPDPACWQIVSRTSYEELDRFIR